MDIIRAIIIFALIIVAMKIELPLYAAIAAGIAGASVMYHISPFEAMKIIGYSAISPDTISLILSLYTVTFLQRMLEKRDHLILAEKSLSGIFNNRRVNAMVAPFIIGLLPSPGAVLIAGPIVDNAGGEYISKEDKTFITSFYRHIPEAFLPVYSSILLALNLAHVDAAVFVLGMLPLIALLFLLGYIYYVRKIPKETGLPKSAEKRKDIKNLVMSLWPIVLTIAIVLIFKIPVYIATIPIIVLYFFVNKFTLKEIIPMFASAIEVKMMLCTIVTMMFKDILTYTGAVQRLPAQFQILPIPTVVVFASIFFFGTIIAGSTAMIALCLPFAFAAIPTGGVPLFILLMSLTYIAMQISPTHICLAIVTDDFKTSMLDLVKRTIPILSIFTVAASVYSYLLYLIL